MTVVIYIHFVITFKDSICLNWFKKKSSLYFTFIIFNSFVWIHSSFFDIEMLLHFWSWVSDIWACDTWSGWVQPFPFCFSNFYMDSLNWWLLFPGWWRVVDGYYLCYTIYFDSSLAFCNILCTHTHTQCYNIILSM